MRESAYSKMSENPVTPTGKDTRRQSMMSHTAEKHLDDIEERASEASPERKKFVIQVDKTSE